MAIPLRASIDCAANSMVFAFDFYRDLQRIVNNFAA